MSEDARTVVRFGFFIRKSDRAVLQRYRCCICRRSFSDASKDICFLQHKRTVNKAVGRLMVSGVSLRRTALILKLNRKTVVRKFLFLGGLAQDHLLATNSEKPKCESVEFDDLETIEHSKLKPLSVTLAVEHGTRRILGFSVSQMPAKGLLSNKSLKKYGSRPDKRSTGRNILFEKIKPFIEPTAMFRSDQNPYYPADLKRHFPYCRHETFRSRRSCVTGQGELKKVGFDPLFSLNHTCAMLRANINRLFRKTWCTTKKAECLSHHIALYSVFHNARLDS
jgi:hypothetical protein